MKNKVGKKIPKMAVTKQIDFLANAERIPKDAERLFVVFGKQIWKTEWVFKRLKKNRYGSFRGFL